jgi:PTH1 family peptidyl-tRNA hydrolase
MKLLVGLGNPGTEYAKTRHNMGFQAVDELVRRFSFDAFKSEHKGLLAKGQIANERCLILKPETYMNLSGESVQSVMAFYKIQPQDIIVFHDDLDLPVGKVKVKIGGGSGGHNGIKNIDSHIGVNYMRVRIGVDKNKMIDTANYVLGKPSPDEQKILDVVFEQIAQNIELLLKGDMCAFMNKIK